MPIQDYYELPQVVTILPGWDCEVKDCQLPACQQASEGLAETIDLDLDRIVIYNLVNVPGRWQEIEKILDGGPQPTQPQPILPHSA